MTTLTEKLETLEGQLADQNAVIAGYIDTVEAKLQLMNDNLSILQENGAANTKAILAALGQTAACFPCPTPSIVVPPIGSTPNPIDEDHCKRAQAFLATISAILTGMDTLQSFNVVGSFNVINDAISEVVGALAGGESIPLPSFPETVNIVGDYVSYAGERVFSGVGLMEQFTPLLPTLTNALYSSATPETAQSAYNASIEGSGVSNGARLLFEAVAYSALYNYFFDPSSTPDLSGFDGSVCAIAPGTCFFIDLVDVTFNVGGTFGASGADFGPFVAIGEIATTGGPYTSSPSAFFTDDLINWHIYHDGPNTTILSHRAEGPTSASLLDTINLGNSAETATIVGVHTGTWFVFGTTGTRVWFCAP